jgi:hypothetical protein
MMTLYGPDTNGGSKVSFPGSAAANQYHILGFLGEGAAMKSFH